MDYVVVEALSHLNGQLSDPVEFFQAVHDDYEEHKDSDFDRFRSAFVSHGFEAGEELVEYLDANGRFDLIAKIVEQPPDELASAYLAQEKADDEPVSEQDGPGTAAAWQALLSEYSEHWNGDEANWPAFEQYVLYYAGEQGLTEPAERFFARAAAEDKRALFAEYGVELPSGSDGEDDDAENTLWKAAIEQFGSSWGAWDGSETGWAEYRDWFYDATNSQDPNMYALAYERLQPLDGLAPGERVGPLRELGFDVSGAGAPGADVRLEDFRAVADDPAIEGIDHEVLEQLLNDPEFEQRLSEAEDSVDAELDEAVAEAEAS